MSSGPFRVYDFIHQYIPTVTFDEISACYKKYAKELIKPSPIITARIPEGLDRAYGIHLRKSDKIANFDLCHLTSMNEFDVITNKVLDDITAIIQAETNPSFLIVSEDKAWKTEFAQKIQALTDKPVQFITLDYTNTEGYANLESVLDLFCLSRCKIIFQGIKYSTFSMVANLLGHGTLKNYSHCVESGKDCLIHFWKSVFNMNDSTEIEYYRKFAQDCHVAMIETNIRGPITSQSGPASQ
jgi:hypothetical protein